MFSLPLVAHCGRYSRQVTVVILDTNALPHGHYSDRAMTRLIEVAGSGASLVIPEVVVWEWAEHAHASHTALIETIRQHRVDALVVPGPSMADAPSIDTIISTMRKLLQFRATVWSPPEKVWRDALRQQVLQVGCGETKKEVKTGAADAVVLACVESELESADGAVVLVTSDRRLRDLCRSKFSQVRVASGSGDLLSQLNTFEPAEEDLALRLEENLVAYLRRNTTGGRQAMPFDDFGFELQSGSVRFGKDTSPRVAAMQLERIDIAEVHGIEITRTEERRYGLADLRIFGDVSVVIIDQHETSPGHYELSPERVDFPNVHVDVTVATRWNHNWQLEGIEPTGVAVIVLSSPEDEMLDDDDVPAFRAIASQEFSLPRGRGQS